MKNFAASPLRFALSNAFGSSPKLGGAFLLVGCLLGVGDVARADLLGDEVTMRVRVEGINMFDQTMTTIVTADDSDAMVFANETLEFTVDPFANGFVVTNTGAIGVALSDPDVFEMSDMDFASPLVVSSVDFTHNWFFVNAFTSFTTDSASVNFTSNSSFSVGRVMTVTFDTEPPFTDSCSGDGGDQMGCTDCPCANNAPMGTIGGCLNSAGTSSRLLPSGSGSITAADLRFEASGVAPSASCVLVSGSGLAPGNAANPCFGINSGLTSLALDGLRCTVQGVLRHGVRQSDASGDVGVTTSGWGSADDFAQFEAFTAGDTKHFQIFYRDTGNCGSGQNTTQAVSLAIAP